MELNQNLLNEIIEMRNKMGLTHNQNLIEKFQNNDKKLINEDEELPVETPVEASAIVSAGNPREELVEQVVKWLGLKMVQNSEQLENALYNNGNGTSIKITKEGGGFESRIVRSIDELMDAVNASARVSKEVDFAKELASTLNKNTDIRFQFSRDVFNGNVAETIGTYVTSRNTTRGTMVAVTGSAELRRINNVLTERVETLCDEVDNIMGKTKQADIETKVLSDDFKSSTGTYKLMDELQGDATTSKFTTISKNAQEKINTLTNRLNNAESAFNSIKSKITGLSTTDTDKLSKNLEAAKTQYVKKIKDTIANLNNIKNEADNLAKKEAEDAKAWLTDNTTAPITQNAGSTAIRILYGTLELKDILSAKVYEGLLLFKNKIKSLLNKNIKTNFNDKGGVLLTRPINYFLKGLRGVVETCVRIFEDVIYYFNLRGTDAKSYIEDIFNLVVKGEGTFKTTISETESKVKGIINEMLRISKDMNNIEGNLVTTTTKQGLARLKLKSLYNELSAALRNTSSRRTYDDILENGELVKKIQSLENLMKKVQDDLLVLKNAEMEGAAELYNWLSISNATDDSLISKILILTKELDENALTRSWGKNTLLHIDPELMIPGSGAIISRLKKFTQTKSFFTNTKNIEIVDTKVEKLSNDINSSTSLLGKENLKELWKNGPLDAVKKAFKEITKKCFNFMTYSHFVNIDVIKKIFAVHGPIKGILTLSVREVIIHVVFTTLYELLRELAFLLDGILCTDKDEGVRGFCVTDYFIGLLAGIGQDYDVASFKTAASSLYDRTRANVFDVIGETLEAYFSDYRKWIVVPLFNDGSAALTTILASIPYISPEWAKDFLNTEMSTFEDHMGELCADVAGLIKRMFSMPKKDYLDDEIQKLREKYENQNKSILDTGYIYSGATNSPAAQQKRKEDIENAKQFMEYNKKENTGTGLPPSINNDVKITLDTKDKDGKIVEIGLLDGFFELLDYTDEPIGEYKFKDGTTYNFEPDPGNAYIENAIQIKKWYDENKVIGINDFIGNKFYKWFNRLDLNEDYINKKRKEGKLNIVNGQYLKQPSENVYNAYFESPDGYLWNVSLLDKVITIDRLKELIKTDSKKRRAERALREKNEDIKKLNDNVGNDLTNAKRNLENTRKKLDDMISRDQDEAESPFFGTYALTRVLIEGSKTICTSNESFFYQGGFQKLGTILKENGFCNSKNEFKGKTMVGFQTIEGYENQVKRLEDEYEKTYKKIQSIYESTKNINKYSLIINEYLIKNKINYGDMKKLNNRYFLNESKRFDEDDYKHWKDTFKFQAVDEKNPGKYKDVKINMEDVMDRINHYRKKYDEDDAFVRAVVDTHENIVRFMFTKELANIKEGFEPTGLAKILLNIRESRGEMEVWSVARPASGNWFLVKGDFTPKELAGMDLQKNEPADKEPKKHEDPLNSLKKKENSAIERLENDEKDGFEELPKIVKQKLRQKFGRGWTTEKPNENMEEFYDVSEIGSVFGDSVKIYKLNANEDFFDYITKFHSEVTPKRGFCRALKLVKNDENISNTQKRYIRHLLSICENKYEGNLGLTIRIPKSEN